MPVSGSIAAPDQFAPPATPGTWIVPRCDGGVKSGPWSYRATMSSASLRISGVRSIRSSSRTPWMSIGAGRVGNGWVFAAFSPGTPEAGTGRSSIGQTGWPVTRSKT